MNVSLAYARVSTKQQELERQLQAFRELGIPEEHIYTDKITGTTMERDGLDACLKALRAGDTFIVYDLDRLGRDAGGMITFMDDLGKREIAFKVLSGMGSFIDTSTEMGKTIAKFAMVIAEMERKAILARTAEGRAIAKAKGVKFGAPRTIGKDNIETLQLLLGGGMARAKAAKKAGMGRSRSYELVKGDGTLTEEAQLIIAGKA